MLSGASPAGLPERQGPPPGLCLHVYHFEGGSGEGLNKNLPSPTAVGADTAEGGLWLGQGERQRGRVWGREEGAKGRGLGRVYRGWDTVTRTDGQGKRRGAGAEGQRDGAKGWIEG